MTLLPLLLAALSLFACQAEGPTGLTTADFSDIRFQVAHGRPFGIVLLETPDQPHSFLHRRLPIADWEWLWIDADGRDAPQKRLKLLRPAWQRQSLAQGADSLRVVLQRDAILDGLALALEVEYALYADRTFTATYRVQNNSAQTARQPFVMLGFPGFTHIKRIHRIANGQESRRPLMPHTHFGQEVRAANRREATLLAQQWPAGPSDVLTSMLSMITAEGVYTLEATCRPDADVLRATARHVAKSAYLTSHLYAVLQDIPPAGARRLQIEYRLHVGDQAPVRNF